MIRSLCRTATGELRRNLTVPEIEAALHDPNCTLWIDIGLGERENGEFAALLKNVFDVHPLAVEDALSEASGPRLDDWPDHLYIVLMVPRLGPAKRLQSLELDIFVGRNYLLTLHSEPIRALDAIWDQLQRGLERRMIEGPDHLLYHLSDAVVADYMPIVEAIDDDVEVLEAEIFDRPRRGTVAHIFRLRRTLMELRRRIAAMREVVNKLARDEYPMIDAKDRVYFRDVYDHLVRLYDLVDGQRDMVIGALDSYVSVASNRLNEIMRTLTVVSILFLPLNFITGFFGMNFFAEPFNIDNPFSPYLLFALCMIALTLLPLGMLWYIRRKGWLRPMLRDTPR
jgi:magnesium transporter